MGGGSHYESSPDPITESHHPTQPDDIVSQPKNLAEASSMVEAEAEVAPSRKADEDVHASSKSASSTLEPNGSDRASMDGDGGERGAGKASAEGGTQDQGVRTVVSRSGIVISTATFGSNNTGVQYGRFVADGPVTWNVSLLGKK